MGGLRLRIGILILLYVGTLAYATSYFYKHRNDSRFDFFATSNGLVSFIQFETWFHSSSEVQPGDLIQRVDREAFSPERAREIFESRKPGRPMSFTLKRGTQTIETSSNLKRHSRQSVLSLFVIPIILSLICFSMALAVLFAKALKRVNRASVEVFSALCVFLAFLYLSIFPVMTFGVPYSFSLLVPILAVLFVHLFLVYPKSKGGRHFRSIAMTSAYLGALTVMGFRIWYWDRAPLSLWHQLNLPIVVAAFLVSMMALANTLMTSKDFWARRRARILSIIFGVAWIAIMGAFVALVWEGPYLSIERILAASLFFPATFFVILLKNNVFNLERIFRRGLHQFALLSMSIIFAILLGLGWSEWVTASSNDWLLWVAIAFVVLVLARPFALWIEERIHSLIKTKVPYPDVNQMLERSDKVEDFIRHLAHHFEQHLAMKEIVFRFFSDPTLRWESSNEQIWKFEEGQAIRVGSASPWSSYRSMLYRGDVAIGSIGFDGGDGLAFDPATSEDWQETLKAISRCLEILCLREFISLQQSYLAVGRMQALLAHELKNPLAIIKVSAGLLQTQPDSDRDELIRTIRHEVDRISRALQGVFDHSAKVESKTKVNLEALVKEVREMVLQRFTDRSFILKRDDRQVGDTFVWSEREGLRQAITNLAVNAFEAGSPWVSVSFEIDDLGRLKVVVQDQGPGVPASFDVFKPFATTKPSGTGLGLTQVRSFVERHHGVISVQSAAGQGAQFRLEFPSTFLVPREVGT